MAELRQTLEQKQKLTPQQILQTTLLQLNAVNLEERVNQELEENPVLEVKELEPAETNTDSQDDDIDWDEILNSPEDFAPRTQYDRSKEVRDMPIKDTIDPIDRLISQIRILDISENDRRIAEEIAWNIDEQGYLTTDLEIIADRLDESIENIERVLKIIHRLDPPGIGARDLRECLLIQLKNSNNNELALRIISDYFNDFANKRFERLMDVLKCSHDELYEVIDCISHLNPKPGEGTPTTDAEYIIPDMIVEDVDGELVVSVNDTNLPDLQISPVYIDMLKSGKNSDQEVKKFLRKKLETAQWFIQAVQQRQLTMVKVVKTIIDLQYEFFTGNLSALKPMVLKDVADLINMDVSTISRVTRRKYVQTPYGIFELKYFFSEGVATDNGEEVSNKIVKQQLREIIDNEDKQKPFSDDKLADLLKEKGLPIARRTIAKYREQMKIPVARLRRKLL